MSITLVRKSQIRPLNIIRSDINTTTSGSALITKVIAGTGLSLSSSTGVNPGTGDVTIALSIATASVLGGVKIGSGLTVAVDGTISVTPVATTWGSVTGTLSNQTDLQAALNAKYNNPTGTSSQYIDGTGAYQTFPSTINYANTSGTSTNTYRAIVEDTRVAERTPNEYDDYRVSWEFTNQIQGVNLGASTWWSAMTTQGWHDGYAAWQIIGPASSAIDDFYLRSGVDDIWNTSRRIWHNGDFTSTNVSNWNTAYSWGNHAIQSYATQTYVNNAIANLVDSAPGTLDTLNELAAALGDDPNFATTVTNSIAAKVPQTRTLTINGTALDLSADRSWTISSADGYISDVRLQESTLEFTGEGSAFNGNIDLSTLPFAPQGSYLTAEADTLATVTGRGASTSTAVTFNGGATISGTGGDGSEVLRLTGSASDGFNYSTASVWGNLTAGKTVAHVIGKAESQYNTANFGYRHVADGSSSNHVTIGMFQADNLLNILGNGNVGIGTTSPGYKLDVNGDARVTSNFVAQGDTVTLLNETAGNKNINIRKRFDASSFINWTRSSNTDAYMGVDENENFQIGYASSGLNKSLIFTGNNSEVVRFERSGNIGIGTTIPVTKLNLKESNTGTEGLIITNWNDVNTLFLGSDSSSGGGKITLKTNAGTSNVFISSYSDSYLNGGNVGIGTSSPVTNAAYNRVLHINSPSGVGTVLKLTDTTTGTAAADGFELLQYGVDSYLLNRENGRMLFYTDNNQRMVIDSSGNVGIGTTSPSEKLVVAGRIMAAGSGYTLNPTAPIFGQYSSTRGYVQVPTNGQFEIWTGGTAEIATFYNNQNVAFFGKVGIGTNSPSEKLHVTNSLLVGTSVGSNVVARFSTLSTGKDSTILLSDGVSYSSKISMLSGDLHLSTEGKISAVTVKATSGNVGIETTAPLFNLQVGGGAGTIATTTIRLQNSYLNTNGNYGFNIDAVDNGVDGHDLRFLGRTSPTGAFAERVRIKNSGNVGIGTTTPNDGKLQVFSNSSSAWGIYTYNQNTNGIGLHVETNSYGTEQLLRLSSLSGAGGTNTVKMVVRADGNVGIGTTAPTNRLQIGSIGSSSYGGNDLAIGNGTQVMAFYQSALASTWYTNTNFALLPSGAGSVGNLGVGNDNPQFKIDVTGTGRFTGNVSIGTNYNGFALNVNGTTYVIGGNLYLNVGYKVVNTSDTSSIAFSDDVLDVKGALIPITDSTYNLGTTSLRWRTIYAADLDLTGAATINGNTVWHAGNDGSGSGLDADTVDGVQADNIVYGNARGTNDSVTTDADGLDKTGFYTSGGFVTRPESVDNWMYIQHIKLYNSNTGYQKQIGYDTYDDRMWVRTKNSNTWSSWKQIWTSDSLTNLSQLTNGPGYITSYTETDTLASVTARGAGTNTASVFRGGLYGRKAQVAGDYTSAALWTESYDNTATGIAFHINGNVGKFLEMRTDGILYWEDRQVWTAGNLTNLSQLTNGPGYITGYTETDTLQSVTSRGARTNTGLYINNNNPTLYLQDTDHRSAMIHVNSDYFYILNGAGTNSDGWAQQANSRWLFMGNLNNNDITFGGSGDFAGTVTASGGNSSQWNTAYSWGNHAGLYASINHTHIIDPISETNVPPAGISIQAGPGSSNAQGWAYPYGTRLSAIVGGGRSFEIMSTTYPNGELLMRTLDGPNIWDEWKIMLDANNYSSYAATRTGGNTSGTWPISITGNADSATTATTAGALSSMNISQFTNNSGYITSSALGSYLPLAGGTMTGNLTLGGGTNILFTGGSHAIAGNNTGYLHFYDYTDVYFNNQLVIRGGIRNDNGNVLIDDNLNVAGELAFRDGAGVYSNIIRAAAYPSEGYPDGLNYWLEYQSKGGHHFVLNTDGGVGGGANTMDDFIVWQGAVDGDRLLELSNVGDLTISGRYTEQSSLRYKENIINLESITEKVDRLRPVRYNKIGNTNTEIGLIAEEVAEVFPEFVNYNADGEAESLNYTRLSVVLLQTVKELSDKINKLETK